MPQVNIPECLLNLEKACKYDPKFAAKVASYFGSGGGDTRFTLFAIISEAEHIVNRKEGN